MEELKPSVRYYNSENCRFALYAYSDEPDIIYLSNVFVSKDCRGRDFGNNILQKAEENASMKEAKLMEERFKLLEQGGKSLSSCGLETAKSADNDSVNYL